MPGVARPITARVAAGVRTERVWDEEGWRVREPVDPDEVHILDEGWRPLPEPPPGEPTCWTVVGGATRCEACGDTRERSTSTALTGRHTEVIEAQVARSDYVSKHLREGAVLG